jgi:hypothetical protein
MTTPVLNEKSMLKTRSPALRYRLLALLFLSFLTLPCWSFGAEEPSSKISPAELERLRKLEDKCIECHEDELLLGGGRDGRLRSVAVDGSRYRASIHFKKDLTCFSCHPDAKAEYHPREGVTILSCGDCHDHEDELRQFDVSLHGLALKRGDPQAPQCQDCHGNHYVLSHDDPAFRMAPANAASSCLECHPEQESPDDLSSLVGLDRLSGHGKVDLGEDFEVSRCTYCHYGSHTHKEPEETPSCGYCHRPHFDNDTRVLGRVHLPARGNRGFWLGLLRSLGLLAALAVTVALFFPVFRSTASFFRRKDALGGSGEKGENPSE